MALQNIKGVHEMTKTISISMSENDIQMIDQYCMAHSLTRSKFMVQTAIEQIFVERMADGLLLLNKYYKKATDGTVLTPEDKELLEKAMSYFRR